MVPHSKVLQLPCSDAGMQAFALRCGVGEAILADPVNVQQQNYVFSCCFLKRRLVEKHQEALHVDPRWELLRSL